MNNKYFYITEDGLTIEVPFKTKSGNYMVCDHRRDWDKYRFVDAKGSHIRWIDENEVKYLKMVLEPIGKDEYVNFPEVEERESPYSKTVWEYVVPSENPDLSNNGGSYAYLYRVVEENGWDTVNLNGFFLVENHLYGSDFESQGWVTSKRFDSLEDVHAYIEAFNVGEPA
jgi:hypothetical protein